MPRHSSPGWVPTYRHHKSSGHAKSRIVRTRRTQQGRLTSIADAALVEPTQGGVALHRARHEFRDDRRSEEGGAHQHPEKGVLDPTWHLATSCC